MTLADRLASEGLILTKIPVAHGVVRWVLCKDPCLVGTREAFCSARVFRHQHEVRAVLGADVAARHGDYGWPGPS